MKPTDETLKRLRFLVRVVSRERSRLQETGSRLFTKPFSIEQARQLDRDADLSERVDAFVARFGRLQDTLGDKLIPLLLRALGETPGAAVDNLDRAERLGWLSSTSQWLAARKLRYQMVHEYIEDPAILAAAVQAGPSWWGCWLRPRTICSTKLKRANGWPRRPMTIRLAECDVGHRFRMVKLTGVAARNLILP